jgi:hypothetical protein
MLASRGGTLPGGSLVHVDGVRLNIFTVASNWPTVHPPGDV